MEVSNLGLTGNAGKRLSNQETQTVEELDKLWDKSYVWHPPFDIQLSLYFSLHQ